jgi:membrane peptidoglycan carboxypeptidase
VAINPKDGDILAMVGSRNFFDGQIDGQVNVTLRPRQPGSSFKPFAYATAFEKGYQPETLIVDAPTNFGPDGGGRPYIPRNYDGKFHGVLTMRQALAQSLNVPAVKTLQLAGIDDTIAMAHRLGITTLNDRKRYGLSLVLGGGEVRLLDMASAFSVFANDGNRNVASGILKIEDANGKKYFEKKLETKSVLDAQIARKINSILSDNVARSPIFGPKSSLILDNGRIVAAKTGTTQEFRDAWTVGYTPSLAVGVWAGNNNNFSMKGGADGVFVAAPIWKDYMQKVLGDSEKETFIAYDTQQNKKTVAGDSVEKKITYYDKKSGKKLSPKELAKINPSKVKDKVRTEVEYLPL